MTEGIHYAKEIEAAVLGICLLEPSAFSRIYQTLKAEMFYMDDNQMVFTTLLEMNDNAIPIDLLTVWQRMAQNEVKLHESNIAYYLSRLTLHVASSAHLEYHANLLLEMYRRRELIKLTSQGIDEMDDLKKQGYELNERINQLFAYEQRKDWYTMEEIIFNLMVHQYDIKQGKKNLITSGFQQIDRMNGGFWGGQSIVLGARPSVGKSALMNRIATNIARTGKKVGIISLEMNNTEIAARFAALETETEFGIVYRNLFRDEREHERFYQTISTNVVNLPIFISDKTKVDINDIRVKAYKLKRSYGLDFLMIDYLQLVESSNSNKNYNREQEVAKISRGIKLLAMDMEIPVMVLCQLNRSSTAGKGDNRYPQLSHFRESGAIEQDADVAFILHRDWLAGYETDENGNSTEYQADLLCLKWRSAQPFTMKLDFEPKLMRFKEIGSNVNPAHFRNDAEETPF